jgi:predicted acyltransferase
MDAISAHCALFSEPTEPVIEGNEGIGVMMLPVGDEIVYMDGGRSRAYSFQIMVRNALQTVSLSTIFSISKYIDNMDVADITSGNGSFELESINLANAPAVFNVDETGVTYAMTYEFILNLPKS